MSAKHRKKGIIIVTVMWIVVLLTAMVAVMGRSARLDSRIRHAATELTRCRWACRAGIDTAVAILHQDTTESDSLFDLWSDNPEDLEDVLLQDCRFTVAVTDEASKININFATKDQLMALPEMTEEIADAIVDWRDRDDDISGGGVEGGYYENLPYGYKIRNGPFRTIRELLLIKGVTEELFYGPKDPQTVTTGYGANEGWINYLTCYSVDNDTDADGNRRLNINSADQRTLESSLNLSPGQARWIVDNRPGGGYASIADIINDNSPEKPADSSAASANANATNANAANATEAIPIDLQTFADIADRITVSSRRSVPAKVNVNTADLTVLAVLMGGDDQSYTIAEKIVTYSAGLFYGMESIGELLGAEGLSVEQFKKVANFITTRSNIYNISCTATADRNGDDGAQLTTETVIDRTAVPPTVLFWYQGAGNQSNTNVKEYTQ